MVYKSIKRNDRVLYFNPPLVLKPYRDENDELWIVTDETLELHVYAQTREQLADDLAAELFFLWDEYAHEPSENLTEKAYDLHTNTHFTLKTNPLRRGHLDEFVRCYFNLDQFEASPIPILKES